MNKYKYSGPVMMFDRCVQNNWEGITMAVSEEKARNNLSYRWKKQNNRVAGVSVKLPGKIQLIEEGE